MAELCPCGSGDDFDRCCGPLLRREKQAATAETLMRSRYAAFVCKDMGYLQRTLDSRKRADFDAKAVAAWNAGVTWKGLRVLSVAAGGVDDYAGTVTFEAIFERAASPGSIRETSRFKKKGGLWYYVDGRAPGSNALATSPPPLSAPKIERNASCPCGSGDKYKRCCGR